MDGLPDRPSLALLAAQRRLEQLRSERRPAVGANDYSPLRPAGQPSPWRISLGPQAPAAAERPTDLDGGATVRAYPGILLAMLDRKLEAPGRLWLLLQHLDAAGSGRVTVAEARQALTAAGSPLRLCSWRNLRGLLGRGEGVFWQADDRGRLWLHGAARVAQALGSGRLAGRPVALPLAALLGGVGRARAHFYASFHSGRRAAGPISRATLARLTHVPPRTQRHYDRLSGIRRRRHLAVAAWTPGQAQERAWRHGRALFRLEDRRGRQGRAGQRYLAWQLPNSYEGSHARQSKGRLRKINRQIDLVHSRAQGNGWPPRGRLFFTGGAAACRAYQRRPEHDHYWAHGAGQSGGLTCWLVIPALGAASQSRKKAAGIKEGIN